MSWYRSGTISVTNGSATVTGSGTAWVANAQIGEGFLGPDGRIYEIVDIGSNTSITIGTPYLGSTQAAQAYVIVPTQSYIRDLAAQAADLLNRYATIANTIGEGAFPNGSLANLAFKFSDDPDTGFFRSSANEVTFVAGGVAQFRYGTSGLVFINAAATRMALGLGDSATRNVGTAANTVAAGNDLRLIALMRERLLKEATLRANFADNEYWLHEGLSGMVRKSFSDLFTFARASDATGLTATGQLATVGSNVPRFVGNRGGLLIEDSRTNYALQSENLGNATWEKNGGTSVESQGVINGTEWWRVNGANASTNSSSASNVRQSSITLPAGTYTLHVGFKKTDSSGNPRFRIISTGSVIDITSPSFAGTPDNVPYTPSVTFTTTATLDFFLILFDPAGSSFDVTQIQLEQGSLPSSYIKTESSQVTRSADAVSRSMLSEYSKQKGTFYVILSRTAMQELNAAFATTILSIGGPNRDDTITFFTSGGSRNDIVVRGYPIASFGQFSRPFSLSEEFVKVAFSFDRDLGQYRIACLGSVGSSGVGLAIPPMLAVPELMLNRLGSIGERTYSASKSPFLDLAYIPRALTESELITLTTPEAA